MIDKYMPDEVRALKTAGELPDTVKLNETEDNGEDNFEFGSGGEEVRLIDCVAVQVALCLWAMGMVVTWSLGSAEEGKI